MPCGSDWKDVKMSIFIDCLLVITFVAFIISFTKNGFAGTIIKIGKTWISLFFSAVLNPMVSERIHEWFLYGSITKGINNTLTNLVENNPNDYNLSQVFAKLPEGFLNFLKNYNISLAELEAEYGSATEATDSILLEISRKIALPCSEMISSIIAYIICFVASFFFFRWLHLKIKQRRSPFFRVLDGIMGFMIGVSLGCCAMFALSAVIFTIFQVIIVFDANSPVTSIYENSYVFKFVNQFDIIGFIKNLWNMMI